MFDLFRSRDKAVRYMLGGLLMVVALSMVITLIPGYGSSSGASSSDPVLAEVGGTKLTVKDVQKTVDRFVRSQQIPASAVEAYLPQFLQQMIQERAFVYEAKRLGITVSDDEVLAGLAKTFPTYFKDGALISQPQFEQMLEQAGETIPDMIDQIRDQLAETKLVDSVLQGIIVTPQEVQEEMVKRFEKAKIQYIAFPPAKFRSEVKPSEAEIHAVYDSKSKEPQFAIPEKRAFQVVVVDQAKIEKSINVTDAQLRAAYSASMDNFRVPERVHVRHILVKTTGMNDADKKKALAKAEDLLKQLKGGADFGELAKKNSDDPGSGQKGGDLGWLVHDQTVAAFDKVAFSLPVNQLSGIVTSEFGYHIIEVLEKQSAHLTPFDEVKDKLADEIKKQSVTDKMQSTADQIHAEVAKSPGSVADIAKKYDADLITVEKGAASDPIPTLGVSPEVENALAGMSKPGDVSSVLSLPATRLAIVVLNQVFPSRPGTFDEVKDKIQDYLVNLQSMALSEKRAQEAATKLKAGEDITKVAKSYGLDVVTSTDFGHNDAVEGLDNVSYVEEAFTDPVGTVFGPKNVQGRDLVFKVIGKQSADMSTLGAKRADLVFSVKQRKAQSQQDLFRDSVLARLMAEGKVKENKENIQRLLASYRQR